MTTREKKILTLGAFIGAIVTLAYIDLMIFVAGQCWLVDIVWAIHG